MSRPVGKLRMKSLPLVGRSAPRGLLVILALVFLGTAALWLQGGKGRETGLKTTSMGEGPVSSLTLEVDGMT